MRRDINFLYLATALVLIPAGLITGGKAGVLMLSIGVIGITFYALRFTGLLNIDIFHRIQRFLTFEETDRLDNISRFTILLYTVILFTTLFYYRIHLLIDQIVFLLVIGFLVTGRLKRAGAFLYDWIPFVILLFAYDAMRGIADDIGGRIHYLELIEAEKAIFGGIPTIWLQQEFFVLGAVAWYDIVAAMTYSFHLFLPVMFAYFIWIQDRQLFRKFRDSFILLSYAALITFLLYPSAPPWLANDTGYLQPVHKVLFEMDHVYSMVTIQTIYLLVNANPVAAIPSLHVGFPWLMFLFAMKYWGRRGIVTILLPFGIGLSAVYLGEHYVIDLIIGVAYATAAFLFIEKLYEGNLITKQQ